MAELNTQDREDARLEARILRIEQRLQRIKDLLAREAIPPAEVARLTEERDELTAEGDFSARKLARLRSA